MLYIVCLNRFGVQYSFGLEKNSFRHEALLEQFLIDNAHAKEAITLIQDVYRHYPTKGYALKRPIRVTDSTVFKVSGLQMTTQFYRAIDLNP